MGKQKIIFFLLLCILFCNKAKSQPTLDTIKLCLQHKPHPFAKLDSRNSFIDNDLVNIFGVKAGISYFKRLSFSLGYYQLVNPPKNFKEDIHYVNSHGVDYIIQKGLKMYYFSANVEYSFYETKHWELSMPLQIGIGKTYYQYTAENKKYKTNELLNFIYEPTIAIDYKIIRWVGVNASFGYRFMVAQNGRFNTRFNSPIVTYGISIYYDEIVKSLFPKSRIAKHI